MKVIVYWSLLFFSLSLDNDDTSKEDESINESDTISKANTIAIHRRLISVPLRFRKRRINFEFFSFFIYFF